MFYILARKAIGNNGDLRKNTHMRVSHRFEMCLSPRMHQTPNNRHNPNGYGSLRVTPIACGLEAPKRHGKNTFFIHLHPSYSSIRNYQK